jgi:hypothetical protein
MRRRRHHETGGAIIDMVVVIPLIAIVISGIFFYGWAGRNRLGMDVAARLVIWAPFHHPDFPSLDRIKVENPRVPPHATTPPYEEVCWLDVINSELFQDRLVEYGEEGWVYDHSWWEGQTHGYHGGRRYCWGVYDYGHPFEADKGQTPTTLADYANIVSATTYYPGSLAHDVLQERWMRGMAVDIYANFPVPDGPWRNASPVHHGFALRDGWEWRRQDGTAIEDANAEHLLPTLSKTFETVPSPGDPIATRLSGLYLWRW